MGVQDRALKLYPAYKVWATIMNYHFEVYAVKCLVKSEIVTCL